MKDKKTAITQPIPESGLALLRPVGDLIFWQAPSTHTPSAHTPSTQTEASLCELVKGADAVLCFVADLIHSLK
ncbi:MAG: hypothetical protein GXP29_09175, partial [Planctomycetes bacterium]|nr:hypothetical protein [Planctomycetota bacterium]